MAMLPGPCLTRRALPGGREAPAPGSGQGEHRFHLSPQLVGIGGEVHRDIGPAQALPFLDRPDHFDIMGQSQRPAAQAQGALGGQQLAPEGVAALAIEHLARSQVALGGRHHIGIPASGHTGGFGAQGDAGH